MTQEEKSKAYDEALEKAKQIIVEYDYDAHDNVFMEIFPELKESKDEWIKSCISMILTDANETCFNELNNTFFNGFHITLADCLAWLEKQGESKSAGKMQVSEKLYEHIRNTCACIDDALSSETLADVKDYLSQANYDAQSAFDMIEKQGEQKSADEVEPRFHEGEWITNGDYTWKIVEVKPLVYILQSQDGNIVDDTIFHVNEQFHSFTIKDAKDGDVLYCESSGIEYIIILKQINNRSLDSYCRYNTVDGFAIDVPRVMSIQNNPKPATKEQRDTLIKAMADAGYTFDFEKKELKKIGQNIEMVEALRTEYEKGRADAIAEMQKTVDCTDCTNSKGCLNCEDGNMKETLVQKTAWSVEDMSKVQRVCKYLNEAKKYYADITEVRECIDWLKSLKERVQPQQEWSEEDEEMLENIIDDYDDVEEHNLCDDIGKIMWLKSLKDRVQPQPKVECSKEDETKMRSALAFIKSEFPKKGNEEIMKDTIAWLKSLKDRYTWKPSKEQIEALHDLNLTGDISYMGQARLLIELYNDLKKLTE